MPNFILNLQFLFRPNYWIMNHTYDKIWDIKVAKRLDSGVSITKGEYRAKLGNLELWIGNYPYAYGRGCLSSNNNIRPSRLTILRLHKAIRKIRCTT